MSSNISFSSSSDLTVTTKQFQMVSAFILISNDGEKYFYATRPCLGFKQRIIVNHQKVKEDASQLVQSPLHASFWSTLAAPKNVPAAIIADSVYDWEKDRVDGIKSGPGKSRQGKTRRGGNYKLNSSTGVANWQVSFVGEKDKTCAFGTRFRLFMEHKKSDFLVAEITNTRGEPTKQEWSLEAARLLRTCKISDKVENSTMAGVLRLDCERRKRGKGRTGKSTAVRARGNSIIGGSLLKQEDVSTSEDEEKSKAKDEMRDVVEKFEGNDEGGNEGGNEEWAEFEEEQAAAQRNDDAACYSDEMNDHAAN